MKRVQMRRGVKLPPNAMSVARPSRWGNPWKVAGLPLDPEGKPYTREDVLLWYRLWLGDRLQEDPAFLDPLRGHDLACYCPLTEECHGDDLLQRFAP